MNYLLGFMPVAVAFTVFVLSGVTNATNIIDGFNGQAAGVAAIMPSAMGSIAIQVGDAELARVSLVALDPRHKTHNIPGKFLSYMQAGLPVLANINPGNDLAQLITREGVGRVSTAHSLDLLQRLAEDLADDIAERANASQRCRALSARLFSPQAAVQQITAALAA